MPTNPSANEPVVQPPTELEQIHMQTNNVQNQVSFFFNSLAKNSEISPILLKR